MLKNVIFDMGNVLIRFVPESFVSDLDLPAEEQRLLLEQIFHAREWVCMDEGSLNEASFLEIVKARLPEHLHKAAEKLIFSWDQPLIIIPGMETLIADLKAQGMGIYLLSNASQRQHAYWERIPASHYFDGTLISADVRMIKPGKGIYQLLFERFHLNPEECVFIDDSPKNIETAKLLGMDGFVFSENVDELRSWIERKMK